MIHVEQIQMARQNISPYIKQTPIYTSKQLNQVTKHNIFVKAESLQTTGSFKIRGAINKMKSLSKNGVKNVVAASSGNHGQAVAYAAKLFHMHAKIIVPEDVSLSKKHAIESYGGEVVKYGYTSEERIQYAKSLPDMFIPPYDDAKIIAGQGTIGLELLHQLENIDMVLVPVGGGGLLAGTLIAIKEMKPTIKVIACEPAIANDTQLSLQSNKRIKIAFPETVADGLRTSVPGEMTFPIVQKYIDDIMVVSEEEIRYATKFLFERLKLVVEPSGAVTTAACLANNLLGEQKNIVAIASGGNVDLKNISSII